MVTISYNVNSCSECHFFSDRESPLEGVPVFYCDKNMEEMIEQDDEGNEYYPDIDNEIWSKCPFKT